MTIQTKNPPAGGAGGSLELSSLGGIDGSDHKPPQPNSQIKFQVSAETDFDADIARALTASGWRVAASLLTHAAKLIESADYLSAERNRQRAREQFVEANDLFKLFQEVQRRAGIMAEEFR